MTAQPVIESPIERMFFEAVSPWLRPEIPMTPQVEVETKRGHRRLDFMITDGKTFVVVECDGAAYHNFDTDLNRDVELFQIGAHAIFHFSGSYIHHYSRYLAPILAYFVPDFFIQSPDLSAACPLPVEGAYVRLSPMFPGLRPELAERVIDGWSIGILSTCHQLKTNLRLEVLGRLMLRQHQEKSGEGYEPGGGPR